MSDYWVSHKKYFCKYCEIYIADDAPSRRQHENGLRHKGNRDRYVRGLYKEGERRKKDLEEEKREMARIERAAGAAFARDVSSGHASASSSSSKLPQSTPSASTSKKPDKPTSKWTNYTTAQSLGITDPDEERRLAELERRKTQGVVGEWEVVAPPPPPLPGEEDEVKEEDSKEGLIGQGLPRKREAEASIDDDDGRTFKLRKRKLNAGLDDIWDPGEIPIKLKAKAKQESPSASADPQAAGPVSSGSREGGTLATEPAGKSEGAPDPGEEKPKWKPMGWKRATVPEEGSADVKRGGDEPTATTTLPKEDHLIKDGNGVTVAMETPNESLAPPSVDSAEPILSTVETEIKEEDPPSGTSEPPSTTGLFRKRKIPAGSRGRR